MLTLKSNKVKNGKTIVLDLDETLAFSQQNPHLDQIGIYSNPQLFRLFHPQSQKQICYSLVVDANGTPMRIWGIIRPGVEDFLRFAQSYFENIIIWSAGIHSYVEGICKEIFRISGLNMPRLIWSRNNCVAEPGYFHKPLELLMNELRESHIRIDPKKTLILDDREYTFLRNPENGVLIPPFRPGDSIEELINRSDRSLYQLMDWLNRTEVLNAEDYRLLDKSQIFT